MLNKSGIRKVSATNIRQILANVELQASVGCVVDDALVSTADADGKKIAKAGTPINVDLMDRQTPAVAVVSGKPMNAVLLHDVDVTGGDANGTALIFGFVNVNRVEDGVADLITAAQAVTGASPLLTFLKA